MPRWSKPFERWSLYSHVLAASALIVLVGCAMSWHIYSIRIASQLKRVESESMLKQVQSRATVSPIIVQPDVAQSLAIKISVDDVVRDITRAAQVAGVEIALLSIEHQPATDSQVGKISFNLSGIATYSASKLWMRELLARYQSLAVQSMSIRTLSNEAVRQDMRATLVLFVRD